MSQTKTARQRRAARMRWLRELRKAAQLSLSAVVVLSVCALAVLTVDGGGGGVRHSVPERASPYLLATPLAGFERVFIVLTREQGEAVLAQEARENRLPRPLRSSYVIKGSKDEADLQAKVQTEAEVGDRRFYTEVVDRTRP